MSGREVVIWHMIRALSFATLVVVYWEPLPGIAWFLLFLVFSDIKINGKGLHVSDETPLGAFECDGP